MSLTVRTDQGIELFNLIIITCFNQGLKPGRPYSYIII